MSVPPAPADSRVVVVSGVTHRYRRGSETVDALGGVDLELVAGEMVALVGPSGSGKTTLLNVLCGWEQPDEGTVHWSPAAGARDGAAAPPLDRLPWTDVAIVPQGLGLVEDLTVAENVALAHRLDRTLDAERRRAAAGTAARLMDRLGIARLAGRRPDEVSLGEQQRAAVARALVAAPRLLLADEPTAHQDAVSAGRVLDAIRDAAAAGSCCLIATHSAEVQDAAGRVVRMAGGRIV